MWSILNIPSRIGLVRSSTISGTDPSTSHRWQNPGFDFIPLPASANPSFHRPPGKKKNHGVVKNPDMIIPPKPDLCTPAVTKWVHSSVAVNQHSLLSDRAQRCLADFYKRDYDIIEQLIDVGCHDLDVACRSALTAIVHKGRDLRSHEPKGKKLSI